MFLEFFQRKPDGPSSQNDGKTILTVDGDPVMQIAKRLDGEVPQEVKSIKVKKKREGYIKPQNTKYEH